MFSLMLILIIALQPLPLDTYGSMDGGVSIPDNLYIPVELESVYGLSASVMAVLDDRILISSRGNDNYRLLEWRYGEGVSEVYSDERYMPIYVLPTSGGVAVASIDDATKFSVTKTYRMYLIADNVELLAEATATDLEAVEWRGFAVFLWGEGSEGVGSLKWLIVNGSRAVVGDAASFKYVPSDLEAAACGESIMVAFTIALESPIYVYIVGPGKAAQVAVFQDSYGEVLDIVGCRYILMRWVDRQGSGLAVGDVVTGETYVLADARGVVTGLSIHPSKPWVAISLLEFTAQHLVVFKDGEYSFVKQVRSMDAARMTWIGDNLYYIAEGVRGSRAVYEVTPNGSERIVYSHRGIGYVLPGLDNKSINVLARGRGIELLMVNVDLATGSRNYIMGLGYPHAMTASYAEISNDTFIVVSHDGAENMVRVGRYTSCNVEELYNGADKTLYGCRVPMFGTQSETFTLNNDSLTIEVDIRVETIHYFDMEMGRSFYGVLAFINVSQDGEYNATISIKARQVTQPLILINEGIKDGVSVYVQGPMGYLWIILSPLNSSSGSPRLEGVVVFEPLTLDIIESLGGPLETISIELVRSKPLDTQTGDVEETPGTVEEGGDTPPSEDAEEPVEEGGGEAPIAEEPPQEEASEETGEDMAGEDVSGGDMGMEIVIVAVLVAVSAFAVAGYLLRRRMS